MIYSFITDADSTSSIGYHTTLPKMSEQLDLDGFVIPILEPMSLMSRHFQGWFDNHFHWTLFVKTHLDTHPLPSKMMLSTMSSMLMFQDSGILFEIAIGGRSRLL